MEEYTDTIKGKDMTKTRREDNTIIRGEYKIIRKETEEKGKRANETIV